MNRKDLSGLRQEYAASTFEKKVAHPNPLAQFNIWFDQAMETDIPEPNAMTLATVSPQGHPAARVMLLKGVDHESFVFYSNYQSDKGKHLEHTPRASMVFLWLGLQRQVRIDGKVEKIPAAESDAYFASRPHSSQVGALASPQSKVIPNRKHLEDRFAALDEAHQETPPVRPDHWGGYRLIPERFEFWQGRVSRLHDRLLYVKEGKNWVIHRLAP